MQWQEFTIKIKQNILNYSKNVLDIKLAMQPIRPCQGNYASLTQHQHEIIDCLHVSKAKYCQI